MTATATSLIEAIVDAALNVTSRTRETVLADLIAHARELGRTDVVARLAAAGMQTATRDVADSLHRIAVDLHRAA